MWDSVVQIRHMEASAGKLDLNIKLLIQQLITGVYTNSLFRKQNVRAKPMLYVIAICEIFYLSDWEAI